MIRGTITHKAIEHLITDEKVFVGRGGNLDLAYDDAVKTATLRALTMYAPTLKMMGSHPRVFQNDTLGLVGSFAQMRKNTVSALKLEQHAPEERWELLTPKLKSEYAVESPSLQLNGRIDIVELHGDEIVPVDLKTGESPKEGFFAGHKIQLAAYAHMLEETFGATVHRVKVHYLDSKEMREQVVDKDMRTDLALAASQAHATIAGKLPKRTTETAKCENCGVRRQCYSDALLQLESTNTCVENSKL